MLFHIEQSSFLLLNLLTGMSHGGLNDPFQQLRLKIQFVLPWHSMSHLSSVVNNIRTTLP